MFTGIIEAVGAIARVERRGGDARLVLRAPWRDGALPGVAIGDSVAVNGVCLTVVAAAVEGPTALLSFDASHETLARTALGSLAAGARVNLERALRLGDRLGGHWVTGHVDGLGRLVAVEPRGEARDLRYEVPSTLEPEIVEKGSIAIDGVSLTVNAVWPGGLRVTIIPHTAHATQLLEGGAGKAVHLETDIVAKHLRRLAAFAGASHATGGVDTALLARAGFVE